MYPKNVQWCTDRNWSKRIIKIFSWYASYGTFLISHQISLGRIEENIFRWLFTTETFFVWFLPRDIWSNIKNVPYLAYQCCPWYERYDTFLISDQISCGTDYSLPKHFFCEFYQVSSDRKLKMKTLSDSSETENWN